MLEAKDFLLKWLSIDTCCGKEDRAVDLLLSVLDIEGVDVKVIEDGENRPNIVASFGDEKPIIGFVGHIDTVPVGDKSLWVFSPYGEEKNGVVYGRGAVDDKGRMTSVIFAFRKLVEDNVRGLRIFLFSDEERQKPNTGARFVTEKHWDIVKCDLALGEGGAALGFKDKNLLAVGFGERGALEYKVTFPLESYHTGIGGDTRFDYVKELLEPFEEKRKGFVDDKKLFYSSVPRGRFLRILSSFSKGLSRILEAYDTVTITPSAVEIGGNSGYYNMAPSSITIFYNARIVEGVTPIEIEEAILGRLKRFLGNFKVNIERITHVPPTRSDPNHEFLEFLRENAKSLGYDGVVPMIIPGSSDLSWFRQRGVPSFGFFPVSGKALRYLFMIHKPNEGFPVGELNTAIENTYNVVKGFKEVKSK